MINGLPEDFFNASRGPRQSDPLSPHSKSAQNLNVISYLIWNIIFLNKKRFMWHVSTVDVDDDADMSSRNWSF